MPRYVIERTFPEQLRIPMNAEGADACRAVVAHNSDEGVTWLHSYVSDDCTKSFCVYDGPTPEAIRRSAIANGLPVDQISEVRILTPYFYV
jgi:hypothetical protein